MKIIVPIISAAIIALAAPYFRPDDCCSSRGPLILFGSMFGCGGDEKHGSDDTAVQINEGSDGPELPSGEKSVLTGHRVTFVEIGSVNCIPCKMMRPVMKAVEEGFPGQVKIVFHDVWTPQGKADAMKYGIRVIPTQVFLDSEGKEYFRHEGFFPLDGVVKVLKMKGVQ